MKKNLLIGTFLMSGAALFANSVFAQKAELPAMVSNQQILFKINDVKPVKNEDGLITDCEYNIVLYNRTNSEIESAGMDLSWADDAGNYVLEPVEGGDDPSKNRIKSNNATVTSFVDIPTIKPYSQYTVKATAKTSKCFLLLGNVNYKVTSCRMANTQTTVGKPAAGVSESCARLFKYVSVQNPEYYRGFKPISFEDQENQNANKLQRDLENLSNSQQEIIDVFDRTKNILSTIK